MTSEERIDWLAGIVDGDGSLSTIHRCDKRYNSQYTAVQFGITNYDYSLINYSKLVLDELGIKSIVYTRFYHAPYWVLKINKRDELKKLLFILSNHLQTKVRLSQLAEMAEELGISSYVYDSRCISMAWLGGFFEAEGSFDVRKSLDKRNGRFYNNIRFMVSQGEYHIIDAIRMFLLEHKVVGSIYQNQGGTYMYQSFGIKNLQKIIYMLDDYIVTVKKIEQLVCINDVIKGWNKNKERITWNRDMESFILRERELGNTYKEISSKFYDKYDILLSDSNLKVKFHRLKERLR